MEHLEEWEGLFRQCGEVKEVREVFVSEWHASVVLLLSVSVSVCQINGQKLKGRIYLRHVTYHRHVARTEVEGLHLLFTYTDVPRSLTSVLAPPLMRGSGLYIAPFGAHFHFYASKKIFSLLKTCRFFRSFLKFSPSTSLVLVCAGSVRCGASFWGPSNRVLEKFGSSRRFVIVILNYSIFISFLTSRGFNHNPYVVTPLR